MSVIYPHTTVKQLTQKTTMTKDCLSELIPNCDAFQLPVEAREQRELFKSYSETFAMLARYCEAKEDAMTLRLKGSIKSALRLESACDEIYARLPLWAKW